MDVVWQMSIIEGMVRFIPVPKLCFEAKKIFHRKTDKAITCYSMAENFSRAMPDEWKKDDTIDVFTCAYKRYIASETLGEG